MSFRARYQLVAATIILISCYSAEAQQVCSPDTWSPPREIGGGGRGILALLKDIPIDRKWQDLPTTTRDQLTKLAAERHAAFRQRWSEEALTKKEKILLKCLTREMASAMDNYYRKTYDAIVPPTFSLKDLKSIALARALVRNYLGTFAAARATLTYPDGKLSNLDWDGKPTFDSIRLPDKKAFGDIRNYMSGVTADLKAIDDVTLDDSNKTLKAHVLFDSRAYAAGAFGGGNYGDGAMESVCYLAGLDYDILAGYQLDKGRPKIFTDDDEVLREVNAIYLNSMPLKWLDVGTLNSGLNFELCNTSLVDSLKPASVIGDPTTNEVSKGMILLKNWWMERITASSDAQNKCTAYSAADRTRIWEAYSASQQFNNDGLSPMEGYREQLNAHKNNKITQYRQVAKLALKQVFPDNTILTPQQRQNVIAAIDAEIAFGSFPSIITSKLDKEQGMPQSVAATKWNSAIAEYVTRIGGHYNQNDPVRPNEDAELKAMFAEVKAWVANEYQGYPIDIKALFPYIPFEINTNTDSAITGPSGEIRLGIGTERSKLEYYSLIIHELRHAVWRARVKRFPNAPNDVGPALEGSGVAAETLLLERFAKSTLNDTAYALYALDYGIRDARFVGTTDATLQKYFRADCAGASNPNTIDFTKSIAVSYGLTGSLADTVAKRSHTGTQYFQYIQAGLWMLDAISYLQNQIDASGQRRVDPFVLFACELNVPQRDAAYVAKLKACILAPFEK